AGRELPLTKVVTTIGKPGICVASITRKSHGFDLAQVEGQQMARVNGVTVDVGPITLVDRDQMELGGVRLEFLERWTGVCRIAVAHHGGCHTATRRALLSCG